MSKYEVFIHSEGKVEALERNKVITGPWDDRPSDVQRYIGQALDWIAHPQVIDAEYINEPFIELSILGGLVSVRSYGEIVVQLPVVGTLFSWLGSRNDVE